MCLKTNTNVGSPCETDLISESLKGIFTEKKKKLTFKNFTPKKNCRI